MLQGPATALSTSADDNACALHSIFGVPSSSGKLTAYNARLLAFQLMQAVPDHARQSANVAHMLDNLKGTLYEEFLKRHL